MNENLNPNEDLEVTRQADSSQRSRREFLKKSGKFAFYTPPTIALLMHPGPNAIASNGSYNRSDDDDDSGGGGRSRDDDDGD